MSYNNVLILNFPKISLEAPPLAPALLSEICQLHGVKYKFLDCNLDFFQQLTGQLKHEILNLYAENFVNTLSPAAEHWLNNYFTKLASRCQQHDLVAISVFSYHSIPLVQKFLENYRGQFDSQVVVGGAGVATPMQNFPGQKFYSFLKNKNLIDYWILGEGDAAFADILTQSQVKPIVNNHEFYNLADFDQVPVPNFEQFDLDAYRYKNKRIVSIEGSRGCVRKCTFCDIQNTWGAFKYKDGQKLAEELLYLKERYQVDHFWFNDSLINGSLKAFRDFIRHLAENRKDDFTWSSQAIVRTLSAKDEEDFALLKASGCETLAVGLESFSQSVRFHMGKKFTDNDVDHFFKLSQKYNIRLFILLIVGYPTETQADFEHALRQLDRYQNLCDDGTISGIRIGDTMSLIPGTPIYDMQQKIGIRYNKNAENQSKTWILGENTLSKRIEWRVQMEDYARSLGYNCADKEAHIENLMIKMLDYVQ